MEEMIASNVCRLCLWKTAPLIPIFGSNNLYEKITQLVPISIHPGNGLSQLICGECLYKVELFNEFRSSALKCDKMQQDYRQLWDTHLLSEIDRVSWSSSPDGNGRFRLPSLALARVKTEPPSCDASSPATRPSEQPKDVDKEACPTEIDDEEVMCLTEERRKRRSTSLYSRAPCPESPGCPYICRYCKKELPTSMSLANHERKHIDNVCLICDEKLPSEKALRLHVRTVCNKLNAVNEEPENEVSHEHFKCGTCLRIFRSCIALWRHCVCLSHNQPQSADQLQGTRIPQEDKKELPKRHPTGSVGRGRGMSGYGRGRGMSGYSRGRGVSGYSRGRGVNRYGRGRGVSGYSRGRGKKMVFNKRRVWVYDKTPCDVCGRIFTSNCGMLIHRTHAHK
ncbi:uncharacterized protein LOC124594908 [Schistocerca americana]|uniref:uncharacterized protein LOC124594908 n=1 Tax=Schistocerca americana TaxID=7009 RepID=UPI001F4FB263|nr:uncharacterized protein LOC124594908 [Schistocerca americana]XP_049951001.1 uncharacterized protein LOC126458174 [Schistocerca serialis cubense]